jgi:nicotinamidase-related amidase
MPLALDPKTTVLVLIDLQNGIVARQLSPHDRTGVVANAIRIAEVLAAAGGIIVPVHVAFSPDGGDRLRQETDQSMPIPPGGLPADWADLIPEVRTLPAAVVITKRQWSAFHGTELDLQLRRRGVKTILLCGIATNFGVESTARDAWQLGYDVVIAEDACTSMGDNMHDFAIRHILPRVSRIRSTDEIVAALGRASG